MQLKKLVYLGEICGQIYFSELHITWRRSVCSMKAISVNDVHQDKDNLK